MRTLGRGEYEHWEVFMLPPAFAILVPPRKRGGQGVPLEIAIALAEARMPNAKLRYFLR